MNLGRSQYLGLYIHIPFCVKKCRYCDFLSVPGNDSVRSLYVNALKAEIKSKACVHKLKEWRVDSVFFGGGTPGLLRENDIKEILETLQENFNFANDCEISLETNPGISGFEKLCAFKESGINRLSIGVQSFDDNVLKYLGRIHDAKTAEKAFYDARRAGFDNINIDLMLGLPHNKTDDYLNTLQKALELNPEHLSCYSLIIEENTPLYDAIENGLEAEPSDEIDRQQYHLTKEILSKNGYRQYEISNFSKPGMHSRHNTKYWTLQDYIGFGPGAASYLDGRRFANSNNIHEYIQNSGKCILREDELLSEYERMNEFMMLGFRMMSGPDFEKFKTTFGIDAGEYFKEKLLMLSDQNLIKIELNSSLKIEKAFLTEYGLDFANKVFIEFI